MSAAERHLFAFHGKGKCAGSTAYVFDETEAAARARLLRDDSCEFFDIASSELFAVHFTERTGPMFFENYLAPPPSRGGGTEG